MASNICTQLDGGLTVKLRKRIKEKRVTVCAVLLDSLGNDIFARYHGRTGVPPYAIGYASGGYDLFRSNKRWPEMLRWLRGLYPQAEICIGGVEGLDPWLEGKSRVVSARPSRSRGQSLSLAA